MDLGLEGPGAFPLGSTYINTWGSNYLDPKSMQNNGLLGWLLMVLGRYFTLFGGSGT